MNDSDVSAFFKRATGRDYSPDETCVNDIRRMLMCFHNENKPRQIDIELDWKEVTGLADILQNEELFGKKFLVIFKRLENNNLLMSATIDKEPNNVS